MSGSHENGCAVNNDTDTSGADHTTRIRELNDACRAKLDFACIYVTLAVQQLGEDVVRAALFRVRDFDAFDASNDPYHEHDFGAFELAGERIFWKIDYYDRHLDGGASNPADSAVTSRLMTVMLASDY